MVEYYVTIFFVIVTTYVAYAYEKSFQAKSKLHRKNQKSYGYIFFAIATAAILIFVSGLRYRVGTDYNNYIMMYYGRKDIWLHYLLTFDEPGLPILSKIASFIYDDPATMFFMASLITIGFYIAAISKHCSDTFTFSVLLFLFTGSWVGSFNVVRQYLAASIIFLGHRLIFERKFFKYLLLILCAMCFHRTALVMLPVYFIANRKINLKSIGMLALSVVVIMYSHDFLFSVMSNFKLSDQTQYEYMLTEVNFFRILVAFAPIALYFVTYRRRRKHNDKEVEFYSMLLFVNAAFLLSTSESAYLARVAIFTEAFPAFAFPKLLKYETKLTKTVYTIVITLCYFAYFSYQIYCSSALNNFQWIWERSTLWM